MNTIHFVHVELPCDRCSVDYRCDRHGRRHQYQARIECPGVSDSCRMYRECRLCLGPDPLDDYDDDGELMHGVEHKRIEGVWMTPTNQCYAQFAERDQDVIDDMNFAPGVYPVDFDFEGGEYLRLFWVTAWAPECLPPGWLQEQTQKCKQSLDALPPKIRASLNQKRGEAI